MPESGVDRERRWLRAAGLLAVTFLLAVVQPVVLVAVPLTLLAVTATERKGISILLGLAAGLLAVGGPSRVGLWYLERGWGLLIGGWFVALSLWRPGSRFLTRGLGSVVGSFGTVSLLLWARPGGWAAVDWTITSRLARGAASALEALRVLREGAGVSSALAAAVYETAELQGVVFPALLGLASVAGLGVAWWLYRRVVHGSDGGLGPLKDFRFNDQLIWILITGCLLLLLSDSEGWSRTGVNAVVFMGALYAVRGAAVVVFLSGGVSLIGGLLTLLGLVLLPPLILAGALIIGLGDTWLDIRARTRTLTV